MKWNDLLDVLEEVFIHEHHEDSGDAAGTMRLFVDLYAHMSVNDLKISEHHHETNRLFDHALELGVVPMTYTPSWKRVPSLKS